MSKTSKQKSKQTVNAKLPAIDVLFDTILRHPFIFTALACVLLLPLGFAQWENIGIEGIVLEAAIWIVASTALIAFGSPGSSKKGEYLLNCFFHRFGRCLFGHCRPKRVGGDLYVCAGAVGCFANRRGAV